MKSRRVLFAGGSGQVGRVLARHFHPRGDSVAVLSRKPTNEPWFAVEWDRLTIGPWIEKLNNADLVINLAGRSVNCRYDPGNRREILHLA